ncbi:hypothetical protein MATL_G00038670, partial [Megalops atlanticus]
GTVGRSARPAEPHRSQSPSLTKGYSSGKSCLLTHLKEDIKAHSESGPGNSERMQDGSCDQTLPLPPMLKEVCLGEGDGGVFSKTSSDGELYLDSLAEVEGDEGGFPGLSCFLSQDEMSRSLDLAREAFSRTGDLEETKTPAPLYPQISQDRPEPDGPSPSDDTAFPAKTSGSQRAVAPEMHARQRSAAPVYKQDKPRLLHADLALSDRASASEFCSRAATFIEELSSIFKGPACPDRHGDEDSSSPDSGYLSPKNPCLRGSEVEQQPGRPGVAPKEEEEEGEDAAVDHQGGNSAEEPAAPPRFSQKLKSQEVAEGSPIRLECRVTGNPPPLVRWFCEGRELHHCPDIQITKDADLHTLVIAEAFEDDTGRYTCVASNPLGADNTSAEVYIEGASSSDSETEGSGPKARPGAMPQVQKKTSSVSLTIRSSSPKSPEVAPHRSTLVQPLSAPPQRVQSPVSAQQGGNRPYVAPPVFTKHLQDAQASEGQVVVLECRVRGSPPLRVHWYRQGEEIQDSPDFRILQKKPRSAAEPEEICTLVIAETFPEDAGLFSCIATNHYGSLTSSAQLTVHPGNDDSASNGISGDDSVFEDPQAFPPPPPDGDQSAGTAPEAPQR